ncbi:MAG: SDR family NAD(P)-dependent oxidoreductase, partial [Cyclobacteriaceae bacterium]
GKTACVIGSAEGLGAAFSRELCRRGFDLLLVDNNQSALEALAQEIRTNSKIHVTLLHLDLNDRDAIETLQAAFIENDVNMLIYNAAYGPVRPFLENSAEQLDSYIRVNMATPLHLVRTFIKINTGRKAGLLLLSSIAGFHGTRLLIPYAASKAFCWNLAEGLHYEFRDTELEISACIAGATATPNYLATRPANSWLTPTPMSPDKVARETLNKFGKHLFIVPGMPNKIFHNFLNRILPRSLSSGLHNLAVKKMYG